MLSLIFLIIFWYSVLAQIYCSSFFSHRFYVLIFRISWLPSVSRVILSYAIDENIEIIFWLFLMCVWYEIFLYFSYYFTGSIHPWYIDLITIFVECDVSDIADFIKYAFLTCFDTRYFTKIYKSNIFHKNRPFDVIYSII